jgi:hypothetical protein
LITSITQQLATKLNYENAINILELLLQNICNGIVEEQTISRETEELAQAG